MKKQKILIVDDDTDLVGMLKIRFEADGFLIAEAFDGAEAIEKVKNENPDLILLDVMIPKLNGHQVVRELKKDKKYNNIPIVMISANAQESNINLGMQSGANDYITKPFDIPTLQAVVKKYLKL